MAALLYMDRKVIAVDIDDTLNTFTQTLRETDFPYHPDYSVSEENFRLHLPKVRDGYSEKSELLSTEYTYFKAQIHLRCYELGRARPDAVAFIQWLRSINCDFVFFTYRVLRRANNVSRRWLAENQIPFDFLFRAANKIVFCKTWGIHHLIDDDPLNATHGGVHGLNVYYPAVAGKHPDAHSSARGFESFEEVKVWIQR